MRADTTRAIAALVLLAAFGTCLLGAAPAVAVSLAETLDRIYERGDYQRDLPGLPDVPDPVVVPPEPWSIPLLDDIVTLIVVVVAAVVLLLLLWALASGLMGARFGRRSRGSEDGPADAPDAAGTAEAGPPGLLADADRLARDGRHGEALHLLLLAVIGALRDRGGLQTSHTAREMARRTSLAGEAASAFRELVLAAELAHFGGRPVTDTLYAASRQDARRVLANLGVRA